MWELERLLCAHHVTGKCYFCEQVADYKEAVIMRGASIDKMRARNNTCIHSEIKEYLVYNKHFILTLLTTGIGRPITRIRFNRDPISNRIRFDWVKQTFVPAGQVKPESPVLEYEDKVFAFAIEDCFWAFMRADDANCEFCPEEGELAAADEADSGVFSDVDLNYPVQSQEF